LDLSGLATFSADYGSTGIINIGSATGPADNNHSPFGTLTLGGNNTLTAGTLNVGVNAANGSSANRGAGTLFLGTSNAINADNITVGSGKSNSTTGTGGRVLFNTGLTNPSVTLRGAAGGTARVASMIIYDGSLYTNSSGTVGSGTVDLTGGTVDALVDTLTIAIGKGGTGTGAATGTLTFNAGTIDATTITLAIRGTTTSAAGAVTTGTLNVDGAAELVVGAGGITLGDTSQGQGNAAITGNLNINGGTVTMGGDIRRGAHNDVDAAGIANVLLSAGILDMNANELGTATGPLSLLTIGGGLVEDAPGIHTTAFTMTGGTLQIDLATPFQITGTGLGGWGITGGTWALSNVAIGDYPILTGYTGGSVSGLTFSGFDTDQFQVSLGNDGVLSVVPEPGVVALVAVGIGLVLFGRRRVRALR
jgi:hypothetical protein